ncbi:MAG: FAD-dependent monooxygenase, partial [Clostridia bacterium]|nr:FAD-dependent monooxygenase [Clostridia bacterium]
MNKRQVIIVGAGPGGSTTAFYLAKQGIDVLMLDRAAFPRHKPCGDVQIISNFHVFEDMGIMDDIKRVGQEDHGLVLIESTGEELYLESKTALAYVTPRYDIDDFTCKAAVKAGAELIENFDVRELIMERGV